MTKKSKTRNPPAGPNPAGLEDGHRIGHTPVALDASEASGGRLDNLHIEDALTEMRDRCFGLMAAIRGLDDDHDDETHDGVLWFAGDISDGMARLAEAFSAERQLREAEGR